MQRERFRQFAWFFVAYLVAVILFGAWVRISGSGAGCGNHWPLCNGDVIPTAPQTKTIIEFTHRLTSGLCGVFALILVFWARRQGDPRVFRAALAALFFVLVEGFVGAVLVKKELVVNDASASRAIVIAIHLANTLLLTASAAATAWWADGRRFAGAIGRASGWMLVGLIALVLTSMAGAITALGDTLFPVKPALDAGLWAHIRADLSASQHFLVRLRVFHPLVAALSAALLAAVVASAQRSQRANSEARGPLNWTLLLLAAQVSLGLLNVALAAPGWMQIAHLLVSQGLWIATFLAYLAVGGLRRQSL